MVDDLPKRRTSDHSVVVAFVDNPIAKLIHQVITFIAPFIVMGAAWIFVTVFTTYTNKLNQNTDAINNLIEVVTGHNAEFTEQLSDHNHRIARLEILTDRRLR